jgi:uncharacterized protein
VLACLVAALLASVSGSRADDTASGDALYREGTALADAATSAEQMAIALKALERAAAFGSSRSLIALGDLFGGGRLVSPDELKAEAYYQVAAEAGHEAEAWRGLASLYRSREGALYDAGQALSWCEKAAALGDGTATAMLAEMFAAGEGVKADEATALHYFTQAMESSANPTSVLPKLARLYRTPEGTFYDPAEAMKLLEQAIALGHPGSLMDLGEMHADGEGTKPSEDAARRYFERASSAGLERQADLRLAALYRSPEGELHDQAEARRLYERSAELGEPRASLNLGEMVAKGEGSAADEQKARQYYERAAAGGLEREASRALAALYLSPEGNLKDTAEAMRLYERSAALGDAMSLIRLGDIHAEGTGVPVDEARAKGFYDQAGNAGFLKERAARLARMYRSPEGALNDAGEAAALFEQAAALGDIRSVISLGSMFAEGSGVELDEVKAKELFDLAATKGLKAEATRQMAELYRSPEGALDDIDEAIRLFEFAVSLGDVPSMLALGEMYASGETLRGEKSPAGTDQEEGTN